MRITFPMLLGIVFVVLKLCHVIDWSWFWVLTPFWFPLGLVAFFGAITLLAAAAIAIADRK
jgi:hypothetical protein